MTLFASSSDIPKPANAEWPGLGFLVHGKQLLSSAFLILFGEHNRNTLKDTIVPAVPAIRTGQGHHRIRSGPEPDGWEILKSDNMIWNKAVPIAARLLQSTMPIHFISPNPNYNSKSEYCKENDYLLKGCIGVDLNRHKL